MAFDHLKRFEFDVSTQRRGKINSRFEFPRKIDLAPYYLESVTNPDIASPEDMFELVGVLVHSGHAESGHYYSFIRDRSSPELDQWLEFNDMEVSSFDPANLDENCFGGPQDPHQANAKRSWSAYMLFYDRIEPQHLRSDDQVVEGNHSATCALPPDLMRSINANNGTFLRQYCLHDPAQADMIRDLLDQFSTFEESDQPLYAKTEQQIVELSLEYLSSVSLRMKDASHSEKMLTSLIETLASSPRRCSWALRWLANNEPAFETLLFRCQR